MSTLFVATKASVAMRPSVFACWYIWQGHAACCRLLLLSSPGGWSCTCAGVESWHGPMHSRRCIPALTVAALALPD
jgi:hypothetical protein